MVAHITKVRFDLLSDMEGINRWLDDHMCTQYKQGQPSHTVVHTIISYCVFVTVMVNTVTPLYYSYSFTEIVIMAFIF